MKKRYLAIALALSVVLGCVAQPLAVSAAIDDEEEAQALAPVDELTAGGFYVKETSYIDPENNAFFVTETKQDAEQVIDAYDLDEGVCAISEEIEDCVIVQTDLTDGQAQELEADARVTQVESNYMVYGCSEETGGTSGEELTQWYLDAMNVDENAPGVSGKKVKVELLDSGVSYISALPDVNCVDLTTSEEAREGGFADAIFHDNSGHGTAMAGLIAADAPDGSLTGINPDADLYSVRILDESLQAPVSKAVEGIYWGIENNVDIINMSFGTEINSEALHNAVKAAADAGILMVAAAGNNAGKGILYPAAYPEVIAVGATTSDGTVLTGSATGSELELLAPGSQIISTGMVDGYATGSGTSLATAEVTGIASLLLAQPGATADMVRGLLRATAKEIAGTDAGLVDYGYAKEHFAEYLAAYQNGEVEDAVFENPAVPETYDTEGIVNGLWMTDIHQQLVKDSAVNSTYVTIMSHTAKSADTDYHDSTTHPEYKGLHGFGNYAANLYAIWKFANYTNKGVTASNAKNNALTDLIAVTVNDNADEEENITTETEGPPSGLMDACVKLVKSDPNIKGYEGTDAQKKYLVVGFACHMLGDVYAHRTLVPEYVFDITTEDASYGQNYQPSSSNSKPDSRLDVSDFKNWGNLVTSYNANKSLFTFITLNKHAKDATACKRNYEDNPEFCQERLDFTLNATKTFLSYIATKGNTPKISEIKNIIQQNARQYVELVRYSEYIGKFK